MERTFQEYGFPLRQCPSVTPSVDKTTFFICSGMQEHKFRFLTPDGTRDGSWQQCIRTNDLDEIGDGLHLSSFTMLGNFSFGVPLDYLHSCRMWDTIVTRMGIRPDCTVRIHPDSPHRPIWEQLHYPVLQDTECLWSDGNIGGYCCEIDCRGLEIGNLVNTLGNSTDVGFGWERMLQVYEGRSRVDETSLFRRDLSPILRDHVRTLLVLVSQGIRPSNKNQGYVMRRLLRRCLTLSPTCPDPFLLDTWNEEVKLRENILRMSRRMWKRHHHQSPQWWWETYGLLPSEIPLISQ